MADKFDEELKALKKAKNALDAPESEAQRASQERLLSDLQEELEKSRAASKAKLECQAKQGSLFFAVKGHPIGQWTVESQGLVLYRAGSPSAEAFVTSVPEAVKMTARLVAAAGQA